MRCRSSLLADDAGYAGKETIAQDYRILAVRLLDVGPLLWQLFQAFCTLPTLLLQRCVCAKELDALTSRKYA